MDPNNKPISDKAIESTLKKYSKAESDTFLEEDGLAHAIEKCKLLNKSNHAASFAAKLTAGDRLGDFEIVEEIASGGMGVIYLAKQNPLGREVAVKTVIPSKASEFLLERFRRERMILAELHESNVVNIFSAGTEGEVEYFAMPYIRGTTLKKCVADENSLPDSLKRLSTKDHWNKIANMVIELAEGVQSIHSKNIIHRDITPNNVILATDGRPWLIDFGIATKTSSTLSNDSSELLELSSDGKIGAPRYQAPELNEGFTGKQTDVFGLGVCFFCLVTGQDFFVEDHLENKGYVTSELSKAKSPYSLAAICRKALEPDVKSRYSDADELSADLRRWLRNEPVKAAEYRPDQKAGLWLKRNPIKSILTAGAFAALTIFSYMNNLAAEANAAAKVSNAAAEISKAESKLSRAEAVLGSGDFDAASEMIAKEPELILMSMNDDPDLFLDIVQLLWRTEGIPVALKKIDAARENTVDPKFIARLDLAEADVRYATDFKRSECLAKTALESGTLGELDILYAQGLLASNSVQEQGFLRKVVDRDAFHLRARQLLVMNLIYMGQTNEAKLTLAPGQDLYPDDLSLKLGEAILHQIDSKENQKPIHEDEPVVQRISAIFPSAAEFKSSTYGVTLNRTDIFLEKLFLLQKTDVDKGVVIFPPALFRCLSGVKPTLPEFVNKNYWNDIEVVAERLSTCNPNSLFLYAHARAIFQQRERFNLGDDLLVRALESHSMFPIKDEIIQQLTILRTHVFAYENGDTTEGRQRLLDALKMMKENGRWPNPQNSLWQNFPDTALMLEQFELAEFFCKQWREATETVDTSNSLKSMVYGYSGQAALRLQKYEEAISFCSRALELDPEHQYKNAYKNFRNQAISELKKLVDDLPDVDSKEK